MWKRPVRAGTTAWLAACLMAASCGDDESGSGGAGPVASATSSSAAGTGGEAGGGAAPTGWAVPTPWVPAEPFACPPALGADDLLVDALGPLGLDRSVGIPKSLYTSAGGAIAADPARRSFFHHLQEHVDEIPCFAGNLAGRADAAVLSDHPLTALVADAAAGLDLTLTVGGSFPELDGASPLVDALGALFAGAPWDEAAALAAAEGIPDDVQRAAARVLQGAAEARSLRDQAMTVLAGDTPLTSIYKKGTTQWLVALGSGVDPDLDAFAGLFTATPEGAGRLYEGAARLAQACDEAGLSALAPSAAPFELFVDTPQGGVLLRGGADDVYDPATDPRLAGPLLLVLDTGGDDTYRIPAGATASADNPVSVSIDLDGADRYTYEEVPDANDLPGLLPSDADGRYGGDANYGPFSLSKTARQGAGILGYGYLLDLGGDDDVYQSPRKSQGFGNFGVGILWDDGGADSYEAENGAQGAAIVGLGLLVDEGGDDTYRSFGSSQGFGWVLSVGALYDASGNDHYEMVVDDPVILYSPQTPGTANASLGQGVAFGWRRDDTGTHLAGGIGMLRDRQGDDRYDGAVFVQGAGYWMGLGVLADAAGNDRYNGLFYAQGAGAHFALGAFLEGGGDDAYDVDRPALSSSIGLAHDFSVVFFVEDGGTDHYIGPDRSVGAAKCHGLSLFSENGGDDLYDTHDRAVGYATDYDWAENTCGDSTTLPTIAVFVDAAGTDTYVKPTAAPNADDTSWVTDDPTDATALELSGGLDASSGSTFAYAYGAVFEASGP